MQVETGSERWRHAMVVTCPCCTHRVRASSILRGWDRYPQVDFRDAEWLVTRSQGRGRISHTRVGLFDALDAVDEQDAAPLRERVAAFLTTINDRLRAGVAPTAAAAARARGT